VGEEKRREKEKRREEKNFSKYFLSYKNLYLLTLYSLCLKSYLNGFEKEKGDVWPVLCHTAYCCCRSFPVINQSPVPVLKICSL
jgi:hypothetical protein